MSAGPYFILPKIPCHSHHTIHTVPFAHHPYRRRPFQLRILCNHSRFALPVQGLSTLIAPPYYAFSIPNFPRGIRIAISSRLAGKSPPSKQLHQQQVSAFLRLCRLRHLLNADFGNHSHIPLPAQNRGSLRKNCPSKCFASNTEFFSGTRGRYFLPSQMAYHPCSAPWPKSQQG